MSVFFFSVSTPGSIPDNFDSPVSIYSKTSVTHTPNIVMAAISSKLDAAINVVGIPFLVPYCALCKAIQEGTSTAGLTAPKQNPRAIASNHGKSNIYRDTIAEAAASPNYGQTVKRTTVRPLPENSSSSPPIINIHDKHTCLTQSAQGS